MTQTTRREFLKHAGGAVAALTLGAAASTFGAKKEPSMKFAICNETFFDVKWPQERVFAFAAECGYEGVEIAPFTINPDVTQIAAAERTKLRRAADAAGVKICGLHWILSKTAGGLCLTSADPGVRRRTSEYLGELARFCAELGGDVMILGSPQQRNRPQGMGMVEAYHNAVDVLEAVAPTLEKTGVTLAVEPLSTWETNFVMTAADAVHLIQRVHSPRVRMMLDCKAMWAMEPTPIACVIYTHKADFVHFHANDPNLQGPGFGQLDFVPILRALKEINYDRWVSVEVFDYSPGPEKLARESIAYMRQCLAKA